MKDSKKNSRNSSDQKPESYNPVIYKYIYERENTDIKELAEYFKTKPKAIKSIIVPKGTIIKSISIDNGVIKPIAKVSAAESLEVLKEKLEEFRSLIKSTDIVKSRKKGKRVKKRKSTKAKKSES